MIENSDRGITLNKSLAWTIGASLVAGGLWIGVQVATLGGDIQTMNTQHTETTARLQDRYDNLAIRQTEDRADIRAQSLQINTMQTQNARIEQRLTNIDDSSRRTSDSISELRREIRAALGQSSNNMLPELRPDQP